MFGIRGRGSIYYLAFATQRAEFGHVESLWATIFIIILISVVARGIAVTPLMRWINRERGFHNMRPMKGIRAYVSSYISVSLVRHSLSPVQEALAPTKLPSHRLCCEIEEISTNRV